jgi:plastocyanin
MNIRRFRAKLTPWLVCGLAPLAGNAEVHTVNVMDDNYQPPILQINVGDTVRWVAEINQHLHNVVAEDSSWTSGEEAWRWQYERQFDTAGEHPYYCSRHGAPGADIYSSHNGLIIVQADGDGDPPFQINAALSDAWYNPTTDGQGFFIIVWEDSQFVFLSWFTFDTQRPPEDVTAQLGDPGHRWLTAQGPYQDDTAELDIYVTSGGKFDSVDPPAGAPVRDGSITLRWADCTEGLLSYEIPSQGLAGDIPIQRFVADNVVACEAAQP